jgi:protein-tyrosine kinase
MKTLNRLNDNWTLATAIHKLEARIWRTANRNSIKTILITSAARRDGKSTTVANLATAMALNPKRRILVVDLDFRDPQLNTHFGFDVSCSLGSVLSGKAPIESAIIKTAMPNLDLVLPASEGEDPSLLIRSRVMDKVFDLFRSKYDLIFMDVPALLPVADATALIPYSDGVILMAMAGKTTKKQLTRARELCLGMDANVLGLVVGNIDEVDSDYGYTSYYSSPGIRQEEPETQD